MNEHYEAIMRCLRDILDATESMPETEATRALRCAALKAVTHATGMRAASVVGWRPKPSPALDDETLCTMAGRVHA